MTTIKKLLVTGGAGFIGSRFVRYALEHCAFEQIVVLDALTYAGNRANLEGLEGERCVFIKGDICDEKIVDEITDDVDAIIHFAAQTHNDKSIVEPDLFFKTNVLGTLALLKVASLKALRFHHISTDEVYGDMPFGSTARFTEASPYRPSSPYSASKAAADMLVRSWVRTYGLKATISNSSNNYGTHQHPEKFIPRQIARILTGQKPILYGEGKNVRDWIHVEDHCEALLAILQEGKTGETYLVGADGEKTNLEVLRLILKLMGKDENAFTRVADRPGHDARYAIDASKLKKELGWRPKHVDFEAGLAETIAWYETHPAFWKGVKEVDETVVW